MFSYPDNLPLGVKLFGDMRQGGLFYGKVPLKSEVKFNGSLVPVSENGFFILGFDRDLMQDNKLDIVLSNNKVETVKLNIMKRNWLIQKIEGLPSSMVSPDEVTAERIKKDNLQVKNIREKYSSKVFYNSSFIMPVDGQITSVFGSQRILNGESRAPHSGIDIKARTGTPVKAAADGIVSLVNDDMYLTGKTVMVDHGMGLSTIYVHLDQIDARLGQKVKQGDVIGAVGATGRATGPHLHFGVSVGTTRIDPESFLNIGMPDFMKN
ncbi:MAG: M23 family metallopeptidase [Alphaproteobacteria bacterium]